MSIGKQKFENAEDSLFATMLSEHQTLLRAYICASIIGGHESDDVLQKTNLILWKKRGSWRRGTSFKAWSMTVARFEIMAFRRDKARDRHVYEEDVAALMESKASQFAMKVPERIEALRECVKKMGDENQEMLSAHYSVGFSMEEISQRTGRSVDGVKGKLKRLRRLLNECIQNRLAGGGLG